MVGSTFTAWWWSARCLWRAAGQRGIHVAFLLGVGLVHCAHDHVGSIGAVLARHTDSGAVHVREVPAGLAAERAGLIAGDRIKMVDGVLLDELTAAEIKALLRGPVGTKVQLTVIRGEEVMHIEVVRRPFGEGSTMRAAEERIE